MLFSPRKLPDMVIFFNFFGQWDCCYHDRLQANVSRSEGRKSRVESPEGNQKKKLKVIKAADWYAHLLQTKRHTMMHVLIYITSIFIFSFFLVFFLN